MPIHPFKAGQHVKVESDCIIDAESPLVGVVILVSANYLALAVEFDTHIGTKGEDGEILISMVWGFLQNSGETVTDMFDREWTLTEWRD